MSKKNTTTKFKNVENAATGIAMVASVLPLVKPAIDAVRDYTDKTIEERKKLIAVPELYSKEYPLTVEQAIELLSGCSLKAIPIKVSIKDADIKYRDCFDFQVIKSQPRAKQKVEPGTSILIKYLTQDVIDESQRLFADLEKRKKQIELEKSVKRSERKEKTKKVLSNVTSKVKIGIEKIPTIHNKKNETEEKQYELEDKTQ